MSQLRTATQVAWKQQSSNHAIFWPVGSKMQHKLELLQKYCKLPISRPVFGWYAWGTMVQTWAMAQNSVIDASSSEKYPSKVILSTIMSRNKAPRTSGPAYTATGVCISIAFPSKQTCEWMRFICASPLLCPLILLPDSVLVYYTFFNASETSFLVAPLSFWMARLQNQTAKWL